MLKEQLQCEYSCYSCCNTHVPVRLMLLQGACKRPQPMLHRDQAGELPQPSDYLSPCAFGQWRCFYCSKHATVGESFRHACTA